MFGINDQNQNRQQSCSKKLKCLPSPNLSSVRQNVLRWYQPCNRVFTNPEKEGVKQLSEKEENVETWQIQDMECHRKS